MSMMVSLEDEMYRDRELKRVPQVIRCLKDICANRFCSTPDQIEVQQLAPSDFIPGLKEWKFKGGQAGEPVQMLDHFSTPRDEIFCFIGVSLLSYSTGVHRLLIDQYRVADTWDFTFLHDGPRSIRSAIVDTKPYVVTNNQNLQMTFTSMRTNKYERFAIIGYKGYRKVI